MPWNNQGGGDQGGPWGQGGGQGGGRGGSGGGGNPWGQGSGSQTPPDLDQAIRQGRDALRRVMPGGARDRENHSSCCLSSLYWNLGRNRLLPGEPAAAGRCSALWGMGSHDGARPALSSSIPNREQF